MGETCDCGRWVDDHFPLDCFSKLRARADAAESELDLAKSTLESVDAHCTELGEALAAARRECEGLREFARSVAEYDEYRGDDEDEDPPLEILARIEAKARAALGDSE